MDMHIENLIANFSREVGRIKLEFKKQKESNFAVETAIVSITAAAKGSVLGFLASLFFNGVNPLDPQTFPVVLGGYQPLVNTMMKGNSMILARNLGLATGVRVGVSHVINRLTGKEDSKTEFVAGFSAGVTLGLVSGMRGPSVIPLGIFFALTRTGSFMVKNKKSQFSPGAHG